MKSALSVLDLLACACFLSLGPLTSATAQAEWPLLRLVQTSRVDGERNDLSTIGFVTITPTQALVVGLPQRGEIRYFDDKGTPAGTFGAKGEGPGEFKVLGRAAMWEGDSLWVFDNALHRMTMISPERRLVRSVPWPSTGAPPSGWRAATRVASLSPRGVRREEFLAMGMRPAANGGFQVVAAWVTFTGVIRTVLAEYVFDAGGCNTVDSKGQPLALPLCSFSTSAFAPNGNRFSLVSVSAQQQDRGAFFVTSIDSNGDTLFSREFVAPIDRIEAGELERVIASWQPSLATAKALRSAPQRKRYPTTLNVVVGRDGSTWIEHSGKGSHTWHGITKAGRPIGVLRLPASTRIVAADTGLVWSLETNADGFESIVRNEVKGALK